MAAVPSLQGNGREEHLAVHEEGAGLKRDIAQAAALFGEAVQRGTSPPLGARDLLQYLPLMIRTTATRQYATAHRAWHPLLSMLLLACSSGERWRLGGTLAHCEETLAAWALALLPATLTGRAAPAAQQIACLSSATKRVMNRGAAGLSVLKCVYRCGLAEGGGAAGEHAEAAEADEFDLSAGTHGGVSGGSSKHLQKAQTLARLGSALGQHVPM